MLARLAVIAVLVVLASPASARERHRRRWSVPEFDPAAVGAIAAIVAGGSIVLARRRKR